MEKSMSHTDRRKILTDGSRIIVEACVEAGADTFVGYPITPSDLIYFYATKRFPVVLTAPDEITAIQWMSGLSATGKIPVTATSFPGFALMVETINMAFMMELPMVLILVQRLGPSTGTATQGAQGDLLLLRGLISGGHPIPTFCISSFEDCWTLTALAVEKAVELRTPVVLLTSKEMVKTLRSFDKSILPEIRRVKHCLYDGEGDYQPYAPGENLVPPFLPVGNPKHQVRLTASTHDKNGLLQHPAGDALANTIRLEEKIRKNLPRYTVYELDEEKDGKTLILSYGVTALAAREATKILRGKGFPVSLLIAKTLLPVPKEYYRIFDRYERVLVAEENLGGQYCEILFGGVRPGKVAVVTSVAKMVPPQELVNRVEEMGSGERGEDEQKNP